MTITSNAVVCAFFLFFQSPLQSQASCSKRLDPCEQNNDCCDYHTEDAKEHITTRCEIRTYFDSKSRCFLEDGNEERRPHIVMHVGLHKTGTTSIQGLSVRLSRFLNADGYAVPSASDMKSNTGNQVNLATCFWNETKRFFRCSPSMLESGKKIATRKLSLLLTTEVFDMPEFNFEAFQKDYAQMLPFGNGNDAITTKYVIYYRRYYDFLHSMYNQITKDIISRVTIAENVTAAVAEYDWHESIVDLANDKRQERYAGKYDSLQRYFDAARNSKDDLVVYDFHDRTKGSVEKFYCDAIPNAKHTCEAVQKLNRGQETTSNKSSKLDHSFIAYQAVKAGILRLVRSNYNLSLVRSNYNEAMVAIEEFAKASSTNAPMSSTENSHLKMKCPSKESLHLLLKRSIEYERRFNKGNINVSALRSDFLKQAVTTLCTVDTDHILKSPKWLVFFKKLNERLEKND